MGILGKARILVVDDEPLVLHTLSIILQHYGFEADTSSNLKDAYSRVERNKYDLILTDVLIWDQEITSDMTLKNLDGFDLAKHAKKVNSATEIILITGAPNPIDKQRAEKSGFEYLAKPIVADSIVLLINQMLSNNRSETRKAA